ncbi:hypothetical protein M9H77_33087 [Catharanthus roseus]|uniref:Uncharacterized protein n=1 Tax=Catharanthus roseus TaxID=4058 RepID=A0ACB9ZJK7_CATRO|nr:hypothetical protein M9H77_33087 [Catharanthus roseus]
MNDLSNAALRRQQEIHHCPSFCNPIPSLALYVLLVLFLIGLAVSIFILIVVRNAVLLLLLLFLSALVATFLLWNSLQYMRNGALLFYLHSYPDSDLTLARHGQLVKFTGIVSCGNISLESSYEKVSQCIYTSTLLHEFGEPGLKPADVRESCFQWRLAYSERFSTDFYITDRKSGTRVLVNAGSNSKVFPLVMESRLIETTTNCRVLSSHLQNWLRERNLSVEARPLRLEEGYIKAGSTISVIGMLRKQNDILMIMQPQEIISTGCVWQKLLLPSDYDGLILGPPKMPDVGRDSTALQRVD